MKACSIEKEINTFNSFKNKTCRELIMGKYPQLEDVIFNQNRNAGLRLLDIKSTDIGVCYGGDWGNMLIYASRICQKIIGVEKNNIKHEFIKKRIEEENLTNIKLINSKIGSSVKSVGVFDYAILNGVSVEPCDDNYRIGHLNFLKQVFISMKKGGKIFFAVDNKMYYGSFFSVIWPFQNDRKLFSKAEYIKLLLEAGFKNVKTYAVFPDYKSPLKILPLHENINFNYSPVYIHCSKRTIANKIIGRIQKYLDIIVFKKLKLFNLSPSYIFIARSYR